MQNQIALYLIFLTGSILIIASVLNSDFLLGPEKFEDEEAEKLKRLNYRQPFLTRWIYKLTGAKIYDRDGNLLQDLNHQRRAKKGLYIFLGIIIIILGIIALNSGKFS